MAKRNKTQTKGQKRNRINKKSFTHGFATSKSALNKNAKASSRVDRQIKPGSEGFYRTKNTIKRLKMYNEKPKNEEDRQKRPTEPARIEPNRKFFGNTRTIDSKTLETLRKEYEQAQTQNKTSILLKKHKIPVSLVSTSLKKTENNLLEPFENTFGPKMRRSKPKITVTDMEEYAKQAEEQFETYDVEKDSEQMKIKAIELNEKKDSMLKFLNAGQSKRIYSELHKVIDSSDIICQILDARDPEGTRSIYVENFIKRNCPHKHIVIILNKCDLVPTWATAKWVKHFSRNYPTLVFHASINNPYGKPALFQILRQFDVLHRDKKHISVGFVGYPNVGKSSIINTLKKQACCKSAPIPGETKIWQYVSLTKRIYLIDCPGVVYDVGESDTDKVLKSVIRAEKIDDPAIHIAGILERVSKTHLQKLYGVSNWIDYEDFVGQVAVKYGKLRKGGEPDLKVMAKIMLMDWQRGKIPYFVPPPESREKMLVEEENNEENEEKDKNKEMGISQDLEELKGGDQIFE